MVIEAQGGRDVLRHDADAIGAIGHGSRQAQEEEKRQRQKRPPGSEDVDDGCDEADDDTCDKSERGHSPRVSLSAPARITAH